MCASRCLRSTSWYFRSCSVVTCLCEYASQGPDPRHHGNVYTGSLIQALLVLYFLYMSYCTCFTIFLLQIYGYCDACLCWYLMIFMYFPIACLITWLLYFSNTLLLCLSEMGKLIRSWKNHGHLCLRIEVILILLHAHRKTIYDSMRKFNHRFIFTRYVC